MGIQCAKYIYQFWTDLCIEQEGGLTASDTVGLVVEYAPATGETRVRFPDGVACATTDTSYNTFCPARVVKSFFACSQSFFPHGLLLASKSLYKHPWEATLTLSCASNRRV